LILDFHRGMNTDYWLGILHGVKGKFLDDVSGAAMGPIFNGHRLERKWAAKWDTALYWWWNPQLLPNRRQEIYLTRRAKSPKPKLK
jgi:hypothetical protein